MHTVGSATSPPTLIASVSFFFHVRYDFCQLRGFVKHPIMEGCLAVSDSNVGTTPYLF
jgi:hypothetical protein